MAMSVPDTAQCLWCGYSLRGLTENLCPECGKAFDPADRSTWKHPWNPDWRRFAKPPGKWHASVLIILTLLILESRSGPFGVSEGLLFYITSCLGMLLLPILGGVYVFRLASLIADWRYSKLKKSSRHQRYGMAPYRRWAILPLCAALVLSTGLYNWPLAIRFGLSRRLLEAEVSQLRRAPGTLGKFPRLVGLYRVEKLSLTGDGSVFFVTGYDVIDAVGFLYAPFPGRNQEHIVGNWYSYTDD